MPRIITPESNKKLKREYRARFFTKSMWVFGLSLLLVAVFFIPAYGTLYFYEKSHTNVGGTDQRGDILKMNEAYHAKLQMTHEMAQRVQISETNHLGIAETLSSYANNGLVLNSLEFREDGSSTSVTIRGEAQTRESLLSFEQRIGRDRRFTGFEIPIDSLRVQNEIPFNITFAYHEN